MKRNAIWSRFANELLPRHCLGVSVFHWLSQCRRRRHLQSFYCCWVFHSPSWTHPIVHNVRLARVTPRFSKAFSMYMIRVEHRNNLQKLSNWIISNIGVTSRLIRRYIHSKSINREILRLGAHRRSLALSSGLLPPEPEAITRAEVRRTSDLR